MEIQFKADNRKIVIIAPVKDSLHASLLSDRLNALPYLKVAERKFDKNHATITMYKIPGIFDINQFYADLESMSDLTIKTKEEHESNQNSNS